MFDFVTSPEFALIVAILLAIAPVLLNQIRGLARACSLRQGTPTLQAV